MPRDQRDPLLPPLTPDELGKRDQQEGILDRQLQACSRGSSAFDVERAFQAMRTYVIEIFDVIYAAYTGKRGYQAAWFPQIVNEAIHRVLITSDEHLRYEGLNFNAISDMLVETLREHHLPSTVDTSSDLDSDREWESLLPATLPPPSKPPLPPDVQAQMEGPRHDDPRIWSPLHQRVAALQEMKQLMTGPKLEIPETLVREIIAEQFGIRPEEVTREQIQFEVSGLLPWYPSIHIAPSSSADQLPPPSSSQPAIASNIGTELKRLLEEARIRPEDIADEIGIDARNVYRHLAGTHQPSLVNLGEYEKALSGHLGKRVTLPTPVKRQSVSKTSAKRQ